MREGKKSSLHLTYCQAVTGAIVDIRTKKGNNWLEDHDLIPADLTKLSTAQTQSHLEKISDLYVKRSHLCETLF